MISAKPGDGDVVMGDARKSAKPVELPKAEKRKEPGTARAVAPWKKLAKKTKKEPAAAPAAAAGGAAPAANGEGGVKKEEKKKDMKDYHKMLMGL